jgi:pimeloyl-ACP methyl ester carboxylesterase
MLTIDQEQVDEAHAPDRLAQQIIQQFLTPRAYPRQEREEEVRTTGTPLRLGGGLAASAWGAGPPVLLVHGWEGRGTQWSEFVAPLVAAGRRAIALDAPAHGDSPGTQTNVWNIAQAILAVGHEIGPLAGIVAHSVGAAATTLALAHGLAAERAVLLAGPTSLRRVLHLYAAMIGVAPALLPALEAELETRVGASLDALELLPLSRRLTTPVLIMHDPADPEIPFAAGQALAAAWPGAQLRAIEGPGHRRILRDPTVIAEAVAFLSGQGAAA